MIATEEFVRRRFAEFNAMMFGGRLPELPIELMSTKTLLGQCTSQIKRLPDGRKQHSAFRLRISTYFDLPESVIEDTIIHEMIHYFIALNGLVDSSPHGDIFKALMHSINTNFGRSITISHRGDAPTGAAAATTRRTLHVVAVVKLSSGKTGFKVLPHTDQSIIKYYTAARKAPDVRDVKFYISDNPYFGRFPSSAALKVHIVDPKLLEDALADATPVR